MDKDINVWDNILLALAITKPLLMATDKGYTLLDNEVVLYTRQATPFIWAPESNTVRVVSPVIASSDSLRDRAFLPGVMVIDLTVDALERLTRLGQLTMDQSLVGLDSVFDEFHLEDPLMPGRKYAEFKSKEVNINRLTFTFKHYEEGKVNGDNIQSIGLSLATIVSLKRFLQEQLQRNEVQLSNETLKSVLLYGRGRDISEVQHHYNALWMSRSEEPIAQLLGQALLRDDHRSGKIAPVIIDIAAELALEDDILNSFEARLPDDVRSQLKKSLLTIGQQARQSRRPQRH